MNVLQKISSAAAVAADAAQVAATVATKSGDDAAAGHLSQAQAALEDVGASAVSEVVHPGL